MVDPTTDAEARLAEAERQLGLYRKAINMVDDWFEYSSLRCTVEQNRERVHAILSGLTEALANKERTA